MLGWIIYRRNDSEITPEFHEVNRFINEAKEMGITLKIIKPEQIDLLINSHDRKSIIVDGHSTPLPDFVLPRMGAGTTYYALAVIRHLERLGVPCINSSVSIEAVKDKLYSHQILAESSIPVPKTILAKFPVDLDFVEKNIGFPTVIKTLSGTQGKGVFMASTRKEFSTLMDLASIANEEYNLIIQEMITDSFGRDLRVFVVGGRVIGCMKRTAPQDEFKANFSAGGSVESYPITPEIEWLATEACRILGLEIGGVDLLFDEGHFKICEVNSSPGFKGMEKANDINVAREIFNYIKVRFGLFEQ